jgi:hypothetical protein
MRESGAWAVKFFGRPASYCRAEHGVSATTRPGTGRKTRVSTIKIGCPGFFLGPAMG